MCGLVVALELAMSLTWKPLAEARGGVRVPVPGSTYMVLDCLEQTGSRVPPLAT